MIRDCETTLLRKRATWAMEKELHKVHFMSSEQLSIEEAKSA